MSKMKLREIGMDPMERLYYERKDSRKKAYNARRRVISENRRMTVENCQTDESFLQIQY